MENIDLIPMDSWVFTQDTTRKEPFLWVKEFRIYSEFQEDKLIRKISLHPGINILWAKPAETKNVTLKHGGGISGHSAGKSLFCRLLRFLLGESTFTLKTVKDAILEKFINAAVAAEIVIDGTHWLVIRHLQTGQGEVQRDCSIERLFEDNLFREPYTIFKDYLNTAIMHRMNLKTFPGNGKNIEWGHILPFLTRDQECRMQNLAQWRNPASESDAPSPSVAENSQIIRGILNLMNEEEETLIREHAQLINSKNELDKKIPSLQYHFQQQKNILLRDFPAASIEQFQLAADDMLALAFETLEENITGKLSSLAKPSFSQYEALLNDAVKAENGVSVKEAEIKEQRRLLRFDIEKLRQLSERPTKGKLSWREQNANAAPNRCNVLLTEARRKECPFAYAKPFDFSSHVNFQGVLKEAIQEQKAGINQMRAYISQLSLELKSLKTKAQQARKQYELALASRHEDYIHYLKEKNILTFDLKLVRDAQKAYEDLTSAQKKQKKLEGDIKSSLEDQKMWRAQSELKDRKQHFNNIFQEILRNVLEPQIMAKIELLSDHINIIAQYNGNVRGTTLDIVKLIAFDYATLIVGLEISNGHPGFLIHDSPREADMAEDIYQKLLVFMKQEIEDKCGDKIPFQYIITTTARPPEQMAQKPWLLEPCLDASTASGRLLGVDL